MLEADNGRHYRSQFFSMPELVNYLNNTPETWRIRGSRRNGGHSWTMGVDYEQALVMARDGWPEGIEKLSALAATVPNNVVYTKDYSVAGEYPDVPRYLAGDPFNMVHRGKMKKPKPTMTIVSSIGANCNVSSQQMANFGAAICALIDRLESRHVRVEVIGVWRTTMSGVFSTAFHVKHAEDALDLSAVAFGLGHPAMLRRLGFALAERSPRRLETYSYGSSQSVVSAADLVDAPDGALYIHGVGSAGSACNTLASALEYAKRSINNAYRAAGHEGDLAELEEAE